MEIVQFEIPGRGRHVGFVDGDIVQDVTAHHADLVDLYDVFQAAMRAGRPLTEFLRPSFRTRRNPATAWNTSRY